ncbi:hypothetical protein BJ508DRAFT_328289 [Ascobolus immersus RN42]|uniref:Uncharacterized protein n=1 Tax=Ascobolus immersus RN42 TaxID=1160509 RepID=A0A3N4I0A1_ASCIM|nr:hypothetical protein BJ508DRAFT_328289 [Ascobolus immersus RN42]
MDGAQNNPFPEIPGYLQMNVLQQRQAVLDTFIPQGELHPCVPWNDPNYFEDYDRTQLPLRQDRKNKIAATYHEDGNLAGRWTGMNVYSFCENLDNMNNAATFNALGKHHNTGTDKEWSTISSLVNREVWPRFPTNVEQLVALSLEDWFEFSDFMHFNWRNWYHRGEFIDFDVYLARAKFCQLIGVIHKVDIRLFIHPDQW